MAQIVTVDELAAMVKDGARLGIGGVHFSRLPIALLERVLKLGRKNFVFTSWGGGLPLELLLEANAVRKLIFCFSSLDIFGLAPRFREAMEQKTIDVEEWAALAMIQALHAAHFNLPEMPFQLPAGSDLMSSGDFWKESRSLFSGEPLGYAKRLDIDVLLLHAQRADRAGNIEIQGARGLDVSLLGASRKTLVTVEEIVDTGRLGSGPGSFVLPHSFVTGVAERSGGAYPSSCLPYYSTDYEKLLAYVRCEQTRRKQTSGAGVTDGADRFALTKPRRAFLSAAARVRTHDVTPQCLAKHALANGSRRETEPSYTIDELLAVCLAREYDNSSVCSVGSVSPLAMVSYLLAKRTHAPRLTIIALNGGFIDIDVHPMSLTLAEPLELGSAKVFWGGDDTYHWYYQQGRITHEVITVAQVDVHGRTNNAWIRGDGRVLRLPGQGGMADVANLHRNFTLYLTRHSRERFVESVEFCTAARTLLTDEQRLQAGLHPGAMRLISDLGIFELDPFERRFRLIGIHPAVTVNKIRDRTAGEFLVADPLPVTQPPSGEELNLIRNEIDPFGIRRLEFVPGKERLNAIDEIITAEAGLVRDIGALL